jgi:hypothetical protein
METALTQVQPDRLAVEEVLEEKRVQQEDGVLVARLIKYSHNISPDEAKARLDKALQELVSQVKVSLAELRANIKLDNVIGKAVCRIAEVTVEELETIQNEAKKATAETALAVARSVKNILDGEDDEEYVRECFDGVSANLGSVYWYLQPGSESVPFSISYEDEGEDPFPEPDYKIIVKKEAKAS